MPDIKTEMAKAAAKLEEVKEAEKARITRERSQGNLEALKELAELVGSRKAAELIGFGEHSVTNAIKRNQISLTADIAARGVLSELKRKHTDKLPQVLNQSTVFFCRVPAEKLQGFEIVAESMGIKLKRLD